MISTIGKMVDAVRSKSYELPLSRDYVRHWGLVDAIRELVQNALDSDSPFEYAFADGQMFITSRFAKLEAKTLVLGATSKADRDDAIGSFGEGYKIALLVLTRLGHDVVVLNGDKQWVPCFRESSVFGAEVLCIDETTIRRPDKGVDFVVSGLTAENEQDIRNICLRMQPMMREVIGTKYGHILPERPGKLYVGGLFVCSTSLAYGYDIKPEHLKLERDRQTVSGWDLQSVTKDAWIDTGDLDKVADMVAGNIPDVAYVEYGSNELVREACYQHFQKKHPGHIIVKSKAELDAFVEKGMTKVVHTHSSYYSQVSGATSYKETMGAVIAAKTPFALLSEWYDDNKKYMSRLPSVSFKKLLKAAESWRVK